MKTLRKVVCCAMIAGASLTATKAHADADDDKKFVATATQSDINEIKLSQLAQQKATNPAVKEFADKMVSEHTKMFKSIAPFADKWKVTVATDLDDAHKDVYKKLS